MKQSPFSYQRLEPQADKPDYGMVYCTNGKYSIYGTTVKPTERTTARYSRSPDSPHAFGNAARRICSSLNSTFCSLHFALCILHSAFCNWGCKMRCIDTATHPARNASCEKWRSLSARSISSLPSQWRWMMDPLVSAQFIQCSGGPCYLCPLRLLPG